MSDRLTSPPLCLRTGTPGSVSLRIERIGDRRAMVLRSTPGAHRGALLAADGDTLTEAVGAAQRNRLPLVALLSSSGADMNEGIPALNGWGAAARALVQASGTIPLLFAVDELAVAGPALLLGLADQVVMNSSSYAYVSGPQMVRRFTGEELSNQDLGGAHVHSRTTGAAAVVVADQSDAEQAIAELLSFLPDHNGQLPPTEATSDPLDRPVPEAGALIPTSATGSYDVRQVAGALLDDGELLELRASWAPNLVTGLGRIGGRPIGVVANQPQSIAGTLDIPASQKGARFVGFCDAFNLPLLTLVDTPGFYPGKDLEWRGMIRHGAQLAFAYARATVPRVCVTMRKSYGGAYIVMDSKHMGNDVHLAWPTAEIAVMGASGAAEILLRRGSANEREKFIVDYEEELLNPYVAAERGSVDQVIDPADTRREVAAALEVLATKRERLPARHHDNMPL